MDGERKTTAKVLIGRCSEAYIPFGHLPFHVTRCPEVFFEFLDAFHVIQCTANPRYNVAEGWPLLLLKFSSQNYFVKIYMR